MKLAPIQIFLKHTKNPQLSGFMSNSV